MAFTLTEKAATEVKRIMEEQKSDENTLLRIGVAGGGCSGFAYSLVFDTNYDETVDRRYEYHGVSVVMNKKHALYLDQTTTDFYEGADRRGFTFDDPNAVRACSGCGGH